MKSGEYFFGECLLLIVAVAFLPMMSPADGGFLLMGAPARQSAPHKGGKPSAVLRTVSNEAAMPFRIGETLNYRVAWGAFASAASVQLTIPERRQLVGCATWHFRASAHTLSPLRSLFAIDDQFDSYTDVRTLESCQYETYLDEMGEKENQVLHFLPAGSEVRGAAPVVVVLPGTRDPLGALYALRGVNWDHTPEFRAPVYDGHDIFEMRAARQIPSETVAIAAGDFIATRLSIRLFQYGKEVYGTGFALWLAQDAAHTPVLMEAELPFGNLRVELSSASQ